MYSSMLKALKWVIISALVIAGSVCLLRASEAQSYYLPMAGAVASFGVVYIMSSFLKDMKNNILATCIGVFAVLGIISRYIPMVAYILYGMQLTINPFALWALMILVLGLPVMTFVFYRYD